MRVLALTFKVLSLCGVWLPQDWSEMRRKKLYYNVFSAFLVMGFHIAAFLQIILVCVTEFDLNFFTDVMFTFLTTISVCAKSINFLVRRGKVRSMADMLLKSFCLPRNANEIMIESKNNDFIRWFTIVFNAMGQATLACHLMVPLLQDEENRNSPVRVWLPFNQRTFWCFWTIYAIELPLLVFGVLLNVTTDVVVSGFVLQACAQMDILKYRLNRLTLIVKRALREDRAVSRRAIHCFEQRTLANIVLHHNYIMQYAKRVTETFDVIIVEQFFASVLIFSVIVYVMALKNITRIQKIETVGYLFCMLGELFSYCWFGNEITQKSLEFSNDVYNIEWTELSMKSNKTLIFIMLRATRPVIMQYGNLVILNIESFKGILKITYSAFNFLKESSTT